MTLNRRTLITHGVALTGCAAVSPLLGQPTPATLMSQALADAATERRKPFLFAVVFDPHVIDRFYLPGRENGVEDDESILHANERLLQARTSVNTFRQADGRRVAGVIPGDCFHNDPSADYSFYQENETRIDLFRKAIDGFHAPVHLGFGNHDYDVPRISREMSHRLFLEKLKSDPYSAVNDRDFRFLQVNNFLGKTWDATSSDFNKGIGSLGETQLLWLEPQLAARRPTTVLVHYPLFLIQATEVGGLGCIRCCADMRTASRSSSVGPCISGWTSPIPTDRNIWCWPRRGTTQTAGCFGRQIRRAALSAGWTAIAWSGQRTTRVPTPQQRSGNAVIVQLLC